MARLSAEDADRKVGACPHPCQRRHKCLKTTVPAPQPCNTAAYVATPHTQPEITPAFNASQSPPCQRISVAHALTPLSSASIAMPTTQPTLHLVRSV